MFNHAAGDNLLFVDEEDYLRWLSTFKRYYDPDILCVAAYCLMPNHYHLLLRQESEIPVFRSIYSVWASYSRYYNKKYDSWGSIFRDKLQHNHLTDPRGILQACVYIHRNPLEAGLVDDPADWSWSNYPEWIGIRNGQLFNSAIREMFFKQGEEYLLFMKEYQPTKQ